MFKFLEIKFEDHLLYHRTKSVIAQLDESFLSLDTDWHSNGAIGLWCSTYPQRCIAFGPNCYEVKLKPTATRCGISLKDLMRISEERDSRESYSDIRKYCLEHLVDILYVKDKYNIVGEVIIVNYNEVDSILLVDPPKDKNYKLEVVEHV